MEKTVYGEYSVPPRRASKRHRKNAIKAGSRTHLALLIYTSVASLATYAIVEVLTILFSKEKTAEIIANPYVLWGLQVLCMYVIAFPIYFICTRGLQRPLYERKKLKFSEFTATFFISCAVMIIGSLISQLISLIVTLYTGDIPDNTLNAAVVGTPIWLLILVVVIIGPIFEELIFRKILLDRLSVYGDRLAIAVSAISFGLFHGNINQLIYATGLGIILGYLYTRTRNVIYPILMHMLINFIGSVPSAMLMPKVEKLDEMYAALGEGEALTGADALFEMQVSLETLLVAAMQYGFAIVGFILFIVLTASRKYKFPSGCMVKLPRYTRFRAFFFNFGFILFLLFSILTIALNTFPTLAEDIARMILEVI
ncbi:MAG: CPBP family intramembrane metalloprotease [Clostridia bacterium]|nr:CPBP family intramembrane metalloprotease [Clostridia bacterium]